MSSSSAGGHNALVSAGYLARAGYRVAVLERLDRLGGAAVSTAVFRGVDARLSQYSYLVSLLPERIVDDLGLRIELRRRPTASYSPVPVDRRGTGRAGPGGLLVESSAGAATRQSFADVTGSRTAYAAWQQFHADVAAFARTVWPTLLGPLPSADALRRQVGATTWRELVEEPLGRVIERRFGDDLVRGVVATDALIGTFASLHDPSLVQNRCFLYHQIGGGTGEWRVPVGGMGTVSGELARAAVDAGAVLRTGHEVCAVESDQGGAQVTGVNSDGDFVIDCDWVLSGVAPRVLDRLTGSNRSVDDGPRGSQLKMNLVVDRLPELRSGLDPAVAFAGTMHLNESYTQLEQAYREAAEGTLSSQPPGEIYCHSLTDPSILGPGLASGGGHTLTYFGLHTPTEVFAPDPDGRRTEAARRALCGLNQHLAEPIEDCLATDDDNEACLEVLTPLDLEDCLAMPGGHIFHQDLTWPWLEEGEETGDPGEAWGVASGIPRVLCCGSGARRGGAVSGIAGHNAAHAVLDFAD